MNEKANMGEWPAAGRSGWIDPRKLENSDAILTELETSIWIGRSPRWLQRGRLEGGPYAIPYVSFGRRIGYRVGDVKAWLAARTVTSTSAVTVAARGGAA